ncbi:MAG: IS607 family transposase [Runella sp.]
MLSITEASKLLGVTPKTLREWEKSGKISSIRTEGGHRRYEVKDLIGSRKEQSLTVAYARVSSHDQKEDLKRQEIVLESYCASKGYDFELISDLGSGMNYKKKGLIKLIKLLCSNQIDRLVVTHKDRLMRFGSELIFTLCEIFSCEVVIINKSSESTYEEDLASDVLEIITVFSARLYGSRSHKNKQLVEELQKVAKDLA